VPTFSESFSKRHGPAKPGINYEVVREGQVELRRTLLLAEEGGPSEIPSAPRFRATPDNRLVVIFYVGRTSTSGKSVSENRLQEILTNGEICPAARIPFKRPFISYFTATVRGGSPPSTIVELKPHLKGHGAYF
jgi:hypothetical protein